MDLESNIQPSKAQSKLRKLKTHERPKNYLFTPDYRNSQLAIRGKYRVVLKCNKKSQIVSGGAQPTSLAGRTNLLSRRKRMLSTTTQQHK